MQPPQLNPLLLNAFNTKKPFALFALAGDSFQKTKICFEDSVKKIMPKDLGVVDGFVFAPYELEDDPIYLFPSAKNLSAVKFSTLTTSSIIANELNNTPIPKIDQGQFEQTIRKAQLEMEQNRIKKVVLSRPVIFNQLEILDKLGDLFYVLCEMYPNTLRYLVLTPCGQLWMGATPETLVSISDNEIATMSLSGTRKANEQIAWTNKEMDEHEWVVNYIQSVLENSHCKSIKKSKIKTIPSGPVEHLQTDFTAKIEANSTAAELILGLHPTPAVCGFPLLEAKTFIREQENYHRAYYTGFMGLLSPKDKKLFVNLRCMQLFYDRIVLYVGAGITIDSIPEKEWIETELKSKTLLLAIEKITTFAAAKN